MSKSKTHKSQSLTAAMPSLRRYTDNISRYSLCHTWHSAGPYTLIHRLQPHLLFLAQYSTTQSPWCMLSFFLLTLECHVVMGDLWFVYRVSQLECSILRESVPYVKLNRYDPKHLYPKLNVYGDNDQRKVWTSCISAYCTSTAVSPLTFKVQCSHPFQ